MKFETPYTHTRERSMNFATENNEESLTQQSDAKDADINIIVGRFMKTGQMPEMTAQAIYGDFTSGMDFRMAMDRTREGREAFQELPAELRKRFNNDPAEFIEFATNKDNLVELRKMGLADPEKPIPPEPAPMKVIITNPEPPK